MNLQGVGTALCYQSLRCLGAMRSLGLQHKLGSSWEMLVAYRPLAMSQPCLRPPTDPSREGRSAIRPLRPCVRAPNLRTASLPQSEQQLCVRRKGQVYAKGREHYPKGCHAPRSAGSRRRRTK